MMKYDPSWLADERLTEIKCSSDAGRTTLGEILAMANEIRARRHQEARDVSAVAKDAEEPDKKIKFREFL